MNPETILSHYDRGTLWPDDPGTRDASLADAYRGALALRALRETRGERPVGYKIGFTNRTIWERYRVFAPIWGTVWDTTLARGDAHGSLSLDPICQPRLEPEIAFGMKATPPDDATLEQLFACVDWLAPSFEVVQSHRTGWKFTAAETVADGGLHARLLVGRTTPVVEFADSGKDLDDRLASLRLTLSRDDLVIDEGRGFNVLDGPLHALLHFAHELARCDGAPRLMPGDIVTTGTWTDAWPIEPGQTWRSDFDALVPSLTVALR